MRRAAPARRTDPALRGLAARIALLILDVDGVLTDGRLWFGPGGEALKVFHVRDGQGIRAVRAAGLDVAIISGRSSPMVRARARELGIAMVAQGVDDKLSTARRMAGRRGVALDHCACIGDDAPDLPLLRAVGLGCAVADGHPQVRAAARYVTRLGGGAGAVREVCDLLLEARARA